MMTIRLMHAIAAVFTFIFFFIKQKCAVIAGVPPTKRCALQISRCSRDDTSLTMIPLPSEDYVACTRAACFYEQCGQPKYKRDPDISIDNESIGQHPHD